MALQKFIDDFEIDLEALNRIKKRVFIVGRFNQRAKDAEPEIFLFTKRSDLSPKYVANFTGVDDMNYESFVKALRPAIAERIGKKEDYRFATVEQVVPRLGLHVGESELVLAGDQRGQDRLFLLLRARCLNQRASEDDAGQIRFEHQPRTEGFHQHHDLHGPAADATQFLGHVDAEPAQLGHALPVRFAVAGFAVDEPAALRR